MHRRDARPLLRRCLVLLVGLPLLGLVLTITAELLPDRLVIEELATPASGLDAEDYGVGPTGWRTDEFTECVALTIGLGDAIDGNFVSSAIRSPTLGSCSTAIPRIEAWRSGRGLSKQYDYFRYWHGSAVVSRPLIAAVGVPGTRILMMLGAIAAVTGLACRLARSVGLNPAIGLLAPFVLTTDFVGLPQVIHHAIFTIVMFAGVWLVTDRVDRDQSPTSVATWAFVAGSAYVFVDLLTNPPAAWALTVAVVGLIAARRSDAWVVWKQQLVAGVAWIAGWAWMWFAKWVVAAFVVGPGAVRSDVTSTVGNRLGGDNTGVDDRIFVAIDRNLSAWLDQPLTSVTMLVAIGLVGWSLRRSVRTSTGAEWATRAALVAPALIPFIWFEVLRNHSQVHAFFTFRSVAVSLGILVAALTVSVTSAPVTGSPVGSTAG